MEEMHKVSSTKKFLTLIGHEHNIKTPKWEFLYLNNNYAAEVESATAAIAETTDSFAGVINSRVG